MKAIKYLTVLFAMMTVIFSQCDANNDGLINVLDVVLEVNCILDDCWVPDSTGTDSTIIDIDGNIYETVQIGNQIWTTTNLKTTHYRNGDPIPTVLSDSDWQNTTSGAYAVYNNNESNADTYGYLYNWYAVDDTRGLAPEGWHIPTDEEWMELEMALGMSESEANCSGWRGTDLASQLASRADLWCDGALGNNSNFGTSGFDALPAGYRNNDGNYSSLSDNGYFWTSTEYYSFLAWCRKLHCNHLEISRYTRNKEIGFAVRVVRTVK